MNFLPFSTVLVICQAQNSRKLERACTSQDGASIFLRREGGFLRREGGVLGQRGRVLKKVCSVREQEVGP